MLGSEVATHVIRILLHVAMYALVASFAVSFRVPCFSSLTGYDVIRQISPCSFTCPTRWTDLKLMPVLVSPRKKCHHLQVFIAQCCLEVCCEVISGMVGKLRPIKGEHVGVIRQLDWLSSFSFERVHSRPCK